MAMIFKTEHRCARDLLWMAHQQFYHPHSVLSRKAQVLEITGRWDAAKTAYRTNLDIGLRENNDKLVADSQRRLGELYRQRGEHRLALPLLEGAYQKYVALGDQQGISAAIGSMSLSHMVQGDYAKATDCCRRRLAIAEALGDAKMIGAVSSLMGHIHFYQGEYDQAMDCYQRQLDIATRLGDILTESVVVGNIGNVYHHQGKLARAMECYQRKLTLAETIGDKSGLGIGLGNIGTIYKLRGEFARAMECYQQYLRIAESLGDRKNMGILLGNLGTLYYTVKDYVRAEECYDQAIVINGEIKQQYHLCENYYRNAELLFTQGRSGEARTMAGRARNIAQAIGRHDLDLQSRVLALMAGDSRDRTAAAAEIGQILKESIGEAQRAYALYALWRVARQEEIRDQALEQYRKLDRQSPNSEYSRFIEELTADISSQG